MTGLASCIDALMFTTGSRVYKLVNALNCDRAFSVVDGSTVHLRSRAELKGTVLVCQEANYLHCHMSLLQTDSAIQGHISGPYRHKTGCSGETELVLHMPSSFTFLLHIVQFWGFTGACLNHILQSMLQT
ncbi:TPA: hypothetical protein ACH3X2_003693 [Trebouxia sp. C0005]